MKYFNVIASGFKAPHPWSAKRSTNGTDLSLTRTDRKVLQGPPRPQGADTRGAARREIGVNHQSHPRPFEPQVSALSSRASSLAVHSLQSRVGSPAVTVCGSSNNC